MSRGCSVCESAHCRSIDAALVSGQSCRTVAAAHGLNFQAVNRHRVNHLPQTIRAAAREALDSAAGEETAPMLHMDATLASGLPVAVPAVPTATPEPAPVSTVRRRIRSLQLTDTPPASPADQPVTASAAPVVGVFNLYQSAADLRERAMSILTAAERDRDAKTALMAIREARGILDHMSRLEERQGSTAAAVPLDQSPEWHRTRAAIITALAGHPEARLAVAEALIATGALN